MTFLSSRMKQLFVTRQVARRGEHDVNSNSIARILKIIGNPGLSTIEVTVPIGTHNLNIIFICVTYTDYESFTFALTQRYVGSHSVVA